MNRHEHDDDDNAKAKANKNKPTNKQTIQTNEHKSHNGATTQRLLSNFLALLTYIL